MVLKFRSVLIIIFSFFFFSSRSQEYPQGIRSSGVNATKNAPEVFIHPGGLHNQADLDRMKAQVTAKAHPWIDDWNLLIQDAAAQNTYTATPLANPGENRQRASADAHAAYLNAIRWYISGDIRYADCAINICNAWSSVVNQVPAGTDIPGLSGIPVSEFALAAEVLRICNRWQSENFARFKNMMIKYFYPVCHDFLTNHNGRCIDYFWANWDACNITALVAMGVLCDNHEIFNEGVEYFKNGAGAGSIIHAVCYLHSDSLGQWQESGRDQEHAQLGVGLLGAACQVAWNQGLDLFGYDNNRLLAGAEYVAQTNLMKNVPFEYYNSCQLVNNRWISLNGIGRLDDRPFWELLYNHYVIRRGLRAPCIQRMAELMRPEHGSKDHFGFGTLTFTLNATASPYPPLAVPAMPVGLTATAQTGKVYLKWNPEYTANGYSIQRSTSANGVYTVIASWKNSTYNKYTDMSVFNGICYFYKVAATNQSGTSAYSSAVNATPLAADTLPLGWVMTSIGGGASGSAGYANVSNGTYVISGSAVNAGDLTDNGSYCYRKISGNCVLTARITDISGSLSQTGIMIRETLDANASTVTITLGDGGRRFTKMSYRTSGKAKMDVITGNAYTWLPAWFRLERNGDSFTAYESSDGVTWFRVGSATIRMANTCYVGLAIASGSTTKSGSATIDNVILNQDKIH